MTHGLLTRFALGLLILSLLLGCGVRELARGELQPPQATLKGVSASKPTATGWPLSFIVLLENPNPRELRLLGYDFELTLAGRKVANGGNDTAMVLPAFGQSVIQVPVLVKVVEIIGLWPVLLQPDIAISYQLRGGLHLASLLGGLRVPFRFQGTITPREGMDQLKLFLKNRP